MFSIGIEGAKQVKVQTKYCSEIYDIDSTKTLVVDDQCSRQLLDYHERTEVIRPNKWSSTNNQSWKRVLPVRQKDSTYYVLDKIGKGPLRTAIKGNDVKTLESMQGYTFESIYFKELWFKEPHNKGPLIRTRRLRVDLISSPDTMFSFFDLDYLEELVIGRFCDSVNFSGDIGKFNLNKFKLKQGNAAFFLLTHDIEVKYLDIEHFFPYNTNILNIINGVARQKRIKESNGGLQQAYDAIELDDWSKYNRILKNLDNKRKSMGKPTPNAYILKTLGVEKLKVRGLIDLDGTNGKYNTLILGPKAQMATQNTYKYADNIVMQVNTDEERDYPKLLVNYGESNTNVTVVLTKNIQTEETKWVIPI